MSIDISQPDRARSFQHVRQGEQKPLETTQFDRRLFYGFREGREAIQDSLSGDREWRADLQSGSAKAHGRKQEESFLESLLHDCKREIAIGLLILPLDKV